MLLLQLDAVTTAVDVAAIATSVVGFVAGFLAVLLLGKYVVIPGLRRIVRSRGFDEAVVSLGTNVLNAVVWVAAIAIGFAVAGYGGFLSAFAVFGGAIALAVGFAAQDLLGNFVAGVFILKDKPFEVGDWIQWGDMSGRVEEIDLRVSRVRTFDNELVTVPNGDLANSAVTNPVAYDTLRQKFVFGIGYDDDIETATDIIIEKAEAHEEILDDPGVSVRLVELGDSAVGLQSRWWIADPDRGDFVRVRSEYVTAVKEAFDDAGIDMPYVHRQLTGSVEVIEDVADE
ncbi:mechanosensitive ion channel family protein [Halorubrum ezzemoulense]|uniref:Mechanosensitive ion channel family protein n=1 Tax=Halorubrum ezzemoulense TaxID=337243 RepID=A0A256K0C9_HALEZ|nr:MULTISPECIES: mechanosensitive ion channel family protein [Halorubrum]MDB2270555.1 mechanosensitive ion channel family protein [Halorubrum ezzemoulense]MDB9232965.1 mechanosensitive ion channel family protein [Halorubrum ezzemoulense]MDB9250020.1 mechanosensitive ion channel family protein [Halorubrum ezzemoulense]MDB9260045.1 mechanosensitive ion channel family protein [Halorubrum ezzemoulense]MDB9263408.1 mechanosensitive ion channel family protein [Halorubrum ezzemoulense]